MCRGPQYEPQPPTAQPTNTTAWNMFKALLGVDLSVWDRIFFSSMGWVLSIFNAYAHVRNGFGLNKAALIIIVNSTALAPIGFLYPVALGYTSLRVIIGSALLTTVFGRSPQ